MFCKKCGAEIQPGHKFCIDCGTPVAAADSTNAVFAAEETNTNLYADQYQQPTDVYPDYGASYDRSYDTAYAQEPVQPEPQKLKKKMSKGAKVAIVLGVLVVVLAVTVGVLAVLYITSPSYKIGKSIEAEDYDSAITLYDENYVRGDEDSKDVEAVIFAKLDKIKEDFKNSSINFATASEKIVTISKFENPAIKDKADQVMNYVDSLNTSRTAFEAAKQLAADKKYADAISHYEAVIADDENYEAAQTGLAEMKKAYKNAALASVQSYLDQKDFGGAVKHLTDVKAVIGNDADIDGKIAQIEDAYLDEKIAEADALADKADYVGALNLLRSTESTASDKTKVTNKIDEIKQKYINKVIDEAASLAAAKKYDDAVNVLTDAIVVLPGEEAITDMIAEVNDMRPVKLDAVHVIDSSGGYDYNYSKDLFIDSFGNAYDGRYYFDAYRNPYAIYNLDGQYKHFSCLIVISNSTSSDILANIAFYDENDKLLGSKTGIKKTTGAVRVDLDVTNVKQLKIKVSSNDVYNSSIYVVNAELSK